VSHQVALALADKEFEKFYNFQNSSIESDFDKDLKQKKQLNQTEDDLDKVIKKLEAKKKK